MYLFTKERLTLGEDAVRRKCRLTPKTTSGNECSFETKLLVLERNEKPELFILWLTKFNEKVCLYLQLSTGSKHNGLLEMEKNIALTLCRAAYSRTMSTTQNDDIDQMFTNVPIKLKVLAMS